MLHILNTYKLYILAGVGILVAVIAALSLSGEPASEAVLTAEGSEEAVVERSLVDTLLQLRAVSLSGGIFADPAFTSLRDFGSQIVPEPVGRSNPFAPLSARGTTTRGNTLFEPRR